MGNLLDLGVYFWLIIFALWGGVHGFVATLLGLGAWLGAALMSERAVSWFGDWAATQFSAPLLGPIVVGVVGFVATFALLRALTNMASGIVKGSPFSALNRGMGVLGGIFAGAVLLSLAYFTASLFIPRQSWPQSLLETRTLPLLEIGSAWVAAVAPKEWGDFRIPPLTGEASPNLGEPPAEKQGHAPEGYDPEGYDPGQRRQLERLLNQAQ